MTAKKNSYQTARAARRLKTLDDTCLKAASGGGGSGAGKVTFNPFSITRKIDAASPLLSK